MRLKINESVFKDIQRAKTRLKRIASRINSETPNLLREAAQIGTDYAKSVAPEYTGALKAAIINFQKSKETWVIVSQQPAGDLIPVNVMFDEGTYPNPRIPGTLFFMKKTAAFLEQEIAHKAKIMVERIVERNER